MKIDGQEAVRVSMIANELEAFFKPLLDQFCSNDRTICETCCSSCDQTFGFHRFIENGKELHNHELPGSKEAMRQIEALQKEFGWDRKEGFKLNIGCRLPRTHRSTYCQASFCNKMKPVVTLDKKDKVDSLIKELMEIRQKHGLIY